MKKAFYLYLLTFFLSSNIYAIRNDENILSYNVLTSLKYKYFQQNPNWSGLLGMVSLDYWSRNINDNSIIIWRFPLLKEFPTKNFVDYIEQSVAQTESVVYISSLWFTPGNSMEEALKRAISFLNQKSFQLQRPIRVRIIFSMYKSSPIPTKGASEKVINYLLPDGVSPFLDLSIISYRNPSAFNHSKIIAIDSNKLITGGANFPDKDYDDFNDPVNDLLIEFNIPYIADLGRIYLSKLAVETRIGEEFSINSIACTNTEKYDCNVSNRWYETSEPLLNIFNIPLIFENYNNDYVIGAGKMMNSKEYNDAQFSTDSILSLLNNAQYEINISQQSIKNILPGSTEIQNDTCASIGKAIMRGVKVNVILSSYNGQGLPIVGYDDSAYNDLETQKCVIKNTINIFNLDPSEYLANLNLMHVARWFNEPPFYFNYKYGTAKNHVKFIMVDDQMAYIGSENLYYNNHAEFGVVINSRLLMSKIKNEYWNPTYMKAVASYNGGL